MSNQVLFDTNNVGLLPSNLLGEIMKKLASCIIVVVVFISACGSPENQGNNAEEPTLAAVRADSAVIAEAQVVPIQSAALSLPIGGMVKEVLVTEGDRVTAEQVLVRLEDAHQQANVESAEARLEQAEASYQRLLAGARPEELAAAEAQLKQAQAQLRQTTANVTISDLEAAEAQLEEAQTLINRLQAGPDADDLQAAESQLDQSQTNLTTQRDQLSSAKTNAEIALQQATNDLMNAQTAFSAARWNLEHVESYGTDPVNPSTSNQDGSTQKNKLNDTQKQQYRDAFTQAELNLRNAEDAVHQAQVALDAARQAEITGIRSAEQQIVANQAQLNNVQQGAEADQLASARSQLANARANYTRMTGDQRVAAIDGVQAAVESAQANLSLLRAGSPESELIVAKAQVQTAEADLNQAKLDLAETVLSTPFDGMIAAVDVNENEQIAAGVPVMQLADTSVWQIESTDLTELDIINVQEGASATVTFDALPDLELSGTVTRIRSFGEDRQGDVIYTVVVTPDQHHDRLRWNMTATIRIDPATPSN